MCVYRYNQRVDWLQVRVPTHEDGSCLFWEFATDYYDVGFGVYFEWTIAPSNTVSVHVSESSDEEELEEEGKSKVAVRASEWMSKVKMCVIAQTDWQTIDSMWNKLL